VAGGQDGEQVVREDVLRQDRLAVTTCGAAQGMLAVPDVSMDSRTATGFESQSNQSKQRDAALHSLIARHFRSPELRKLAERVIIDADNEEARQLEEMRRHSIGGFSSGLHGGSHSKSFRQRRRPMSPSPPMQTRDRKIFEGRASTKARASSRGAEVRRRPRTSINSHSSNRSFAHPRHRRNLSNTAGLTKQQQRGRAGNGASQKKYTSERTLNRGKTSSRRPITPRARQRRRENRNTIKEVNLAPLPINVAPEENDDAWFDLEIDPAKVPKETKAGPQDDDDAASTDWGDISLPSNDALHEEPVAEAGNHLITFQRGPVLLPFRDSSFKQHTVGQMTFNPLLQKWENTCEDEENGFMEAFEEDSDTDSDDNDEFGEEVGGEGEGEGEEDENKKKTEEEDSSPPSDAEWKKKTPRSPSSGLKSWFTLSTTDMASLDRSEEISKSVSTFSDDVDLSWTMHHNDLVQLAVERILVSNEAKNHQQF